MRIASTWMKRALNKEKNCLQFLKNLFRATRIWEISYKNIQFKEIVLKIDFEIKTVIIIITPKYKSSEIIKLVTKQPKCLFECFSGSREPSAVFAVHTHTRTHNNKNQNITAFVTI